MRWIQQQVCMHCTLHSPGSPPVASVGSMLAVVVVEAFVVAGAWRVQLLVVVVKVLLQSSN